MKLTSEQIIAFNTLLKGRSAVDHDGAVWSVFYTHCNPACDNYVRLERDGVQIGFDTPESFYERFRAVVPRNPVKESDRRRYRSICLNCEYKSTRFYTERSAQRAGDEHELVTTHRCEIEVGTDERCA